MRFILALALVLGAFAFFVLVFLFPLWTLGSVLVVSACGAAYEVAGDILRNDD